MTEKLYYENFDLNECEAVITAVSELGIATDRTCAYAEGGGQVGDSGVIVKDGVEYLFGNCVKSGGEVVELEGFSKVQLKSDVFHCVENAEGLKVGDRVLVRIDRVKRDGATNFHSALHIVLMAARRVKPEATQIIKGCAITSEGARIDFACEEKFSTDELARIEAEANAIIEANLPVRIYAFDGVKDAWMWECEEFSCPCGGTHKHFTGEVAKVSVKRKNIGKGCDRLVVA